MSAGNSTKPCGSHAQSVNFYVWYQSHSDLADLADNGSPSPDRMDTIPAAFGSIQDRVEPTLPLRTTRNEHFTPNISNPA